MVNDDGCSEWLIMMINYDSLVDNHGFAIKQWMVIQLVKLGLK